MFKKILIANRGEIACRIIATAKKMGISTVAVYSDADSDSLHVQMADEAVRIGVAASADSYLNIRAIVAAAVTTRAEAVAPGYGFLSERAEFCATLTKHGIVFIGPNSNAITAMGDKIQSKIRAKAARVSIVPGFVGALDNDLDAITIANEIGYPVILKASAGGGGKGMRIIHNDGEMKESLRATKSEALASFGDDRVFLEKYIEQPRHIEIQIVGDKHGNIIHLGERECSLQRRHQKVIEEAPSPFLDAKTRSLMGEQAVALACEVGYDSAGTVEFIVDPNKQFYFLEMNTRLQVEHPVTELVYGVDLVELMIRIAAGEKLPITQSQVKPKGWAIESRIYAEDPSRNFLPAIGRLKRYHPPSGQGVRVDSGVTEGSEISLYYDPMIAKLITYGDNRDSARRLMSDSLDRFDIDGLAHNISFLSALINHPRFISGDISTHLIGEDFPHGYSAEPPTGEDFYSLVAVAVARHFVKASRNSQGRGHQPPMDWTVIHGQKFHRCKILSVELINSIHHAELLVDEHRINLQANLDPATKSFDGLVNHQPFAVLLRNGGLKLSLFHQGKAITITVLTSLAAELTARMPIKLPPDRSNQLISPMPGLLVSLTVKTGDTVKEGEVIAVIEAMKMENNLRAERNGIVKELLVKTGDSLAVDQVILEYQ